MPPPKKAAPVKKAAKKQEVTGPSSEPTRPLLTLGPVTAPMVRTTAQMGAPELILRGLELFDVWKPTGDQRAYLILVGGIAFAFLQNAIEALKGRRLVGAPA